MRKKKLTLKSTLEIIKDAFKSFGEDKITRLSGSLAYYTIFSMAPLLIVLISLAGIFLGREAVEGSVYETLDGFLGKTAAAQLQETVKNASLEGKSTVAAIVGGLALLLGATTVFAQIQDSINEIWDIKAKPKRGWLKMIKNRILSFSVVVTLGFLLLVSLAVSTTIDALGSGLKDRFPDITVVTLYIINLVVTLGVTTVLFAVIFKVLPDAIIKWRDVWIGAFTTALLFMAGKLGISLYISQTDIGSTYGTAGSLVILLLWVYYSSMILFIGAAITKSYAEKIGSGIDPKEYAATTRELEVETGKKYVKG